jgi:hypothetical protein
MRKQVAGAPRRMDAVYLDEKEAPAGESLAGHLTQALDQAQALIVVCSPFSVGSKYVAQEIAHFIKTGRGSRIFCVISSGVPNATEEGRPHLEALPLGLRTVPDAEGNPTDVARPVPDRPIAASLGQESPQEWRDAVEKLVSGVLGLSRGELLQARSNRRLIQAGIAAAGVLALGVGAAAVWDGTTRTNVRYYEDFVRRDGVWQGVNRVRAQTVAARDATYKFTFKGSWSRRPLEVTRVNGAGACAIGGLTGVLGRPFT